MTLSRTNPRAKQRWTLLGAVVLALTLLGAIATQASLDTTLFELDKDLTNNNQSVKIGVLNANLSAGATSAQICQAQAGAWANGTLVLIDAERLTLSAGASAAGGGCPSGFGNKFNYTVARGVDSTTPGAHAKGEDITRLVSNSDSGDDWDQVYAAILAGDDDCSTLDAVECAWTQDGRAMSIFTQSKDYDEISDANGATAFWKWRDQSVPDADELDDGFAVKYVDNGNQYLFFGADRFAVNGSKDAGFWFFHRDVFANPLPAGGGDGTFTGLHTAPDDGGADGFCNPAQGGIGGPSATPNCQKYDDNDTGGDILALTTFTGGGAVTTIRIFEWVGPPGSDAALLERSVAGDCLPGPAGTVCATVNDTTIESPWPYSGKSEPATNEIPSGGALEGGINLTDLGLEGCFSSFMATTRSSPSVTADPKDFILGSFEACDTSLTTTPQAGGGGSLTPDSDADNLDEISIGTGSVTVQDSAVLDVKGTTSFTGTLSFYLCGPLDTPNACSDSGVSVGAASGTNPVTSNGTYYSTTATVTEVGRYCWYAFFDSGTEGVPDASDGTIESAEGTGECFEVVPVQPGLSTQATTVVEVGTAISDKATLSGTANQPGTNGGHATYDSINANNGLPAGGNITFNLYGDGDTDCTGSTIFTASRAVSGDGQYPTAAQAAVSYTPSAAGVYRWWASYDGSSPNTLDVDGACNLPNETSTVVDARISIAADDTNAVGDQHTFTVHVEENDGTGWADAAGESVTITWPGLTPGSVDASDCTAGTDADGECDVVINSAVPGVFAAHAAVDVSVGGISVHRETDGLAGNSGDAVKTYVDAYITIAADDTNEVGVSHTFTINVYQDDGIASGDGGDGVDGFGPAPDGTIVSVTLTNSNGASYAVSENTCADDDIDTDGTVSGSCTITFASPTAGQVTGHASVTFSVGGVSLTRATDGLETTTGSGQSNSGDAVKTYVDAYITIAADDTNEVGVSHTFTINVYQDDGIASGDGGDGVDGFGPAPDGTIVGVTLTNSNGASYAVSENTCEADAIDPPDTDGTVSGSCTITFASPTAGQVTGHASVTFSVGGVSLTRATDGLETTTGSGQSNSGDAVKTYVDAYITIGPDGTNTVGDPHTFTVHVFVNEGTGAGWVDAPADQFVDVTLTDTNGAVSALTGTGDTCADPGTDASGECTVTFSSPTAGTVTGHAAVTLTVGTVELMRETDGDETVTGSGVYNSDDAVKIYIAGSIDWTKVDNAGALQGGATFEVCRTHSYNIADALFEALAEPECISGDVVDDTGAGGYTGNDEDSDPGEFLVSGLPLGRYTVKETVAPPGFVKDPDTETVELTPGDTDKTISIAFVNSRPILKITEFGYTNEPTLNEGTFEQFGGILSGTTTYTVKLHNYGTAAADLTNSSLVVSANATCTGGNTLDLSGVTIAAGADSLEYTLTCTYDSPVPAEIEADLVVKYTTNGLERTASGSPATIIFTVAAD